MTDENEQWYVATLIVQCKLENALSPMDCDEQIHLIRAKDSDSAYEKALRLGKDQNVTYQNTYGENVYWEFVGLENLEELFESTIYDGVEIRSRLFDCDNPSKLVQPKNELAVFLARSNPHSPEYRKDDNDSQYK